MQHDQERHEEEQRAARDRERARRAAAAAADACDRAAPAHCVSTTPASAGQDSQTDRRRPTTLRSARAPYWRPRPSSASRRRAAPCRSTCRRDSRCRCTRAGDARCRRPAGARAPMRIFSGRSAEPHRLAGCASPASATRNAARSRVCDRSPAAPTTRPSIRLTSPMKSRDPARVRPLVDLGRRPDLREPAAVHHRDAVGDGHRLLLVVGDDDEGDAEPALQFHQLELRLLAQLLVERGQRLVEQQHARALGQRAGERDALALAAGELVGLRRPKPSSLTSASISVDARGDLARCGSLSCRRPKRDVALDRQMRKQRVALEHHVDRPPVRRHARRCPRRRAGCGLRSASRSRRACAAAWSCRSRRARAARRIRRGRCRATADRPRVTVPKRLVTRLEAHQRLAADSPPSIRSPDRAIAAR